MSSFHVIDVDHVPKNDMDNYNDVSTRINELCEARMKALSDQKQRLAIHEELNSNIRRLSDDVITRINEKVDRATAGLNVDNAAVRQADIEVGSRNFLLRSHLE